jgi:hypothetical protein
MNYTEQTIKVPDFESVDWTIGDTELHRRYPDVPRWKFRQQRILRGLPRGTEGNRWATDEVRNKVRLIHAEDIDWTKIDSDLAREHNVSRERIRQLRKAAWLPSSRTIERNWSLKAKELDWRKTNKVLAEETDIPVGMVSYMRKKYAKVSADPPPALPNIAAVDWTKVDWNERGLAGKYKVGYMEICKLRRVFAPETGGYSGSIPKSYYALRDRLLNGANVE